MTLIKFIFLFLPVCLTIAIWSLFDKAVRETYKITIVGNNVVILKKKDRLRKHNPKDRILWRGNEFYKVIFKHSMYGQKKVLQEFSRSLYSYSNR